MKYQQFGNKYIVRIDRGEEIIESLKVFCAENKITLGSVSAIGAVQKVTLRFFDQNTKKYNDKEFVENLEIANFTGNISTMQGGVYPPTYKAIGGRVYLHCHTTLGNSNYQTLGGHVLSAVVGGTFEAIIEKIDGRVERGLDEGIGLNLLKL